MPITLTPVVRDDLSLLFRLKTTPEQAGFVAPTEITLAQAPYETGAHVFTIRADETIVGLAATIDFRDHAYVMEGDDPESAYLWRLLIGADHQRKGIGRAVVGHVIEWARRRGNPRLTVSVVEENAVALRFYESAGFRATGARVDDEIVLSLTL